MSSIAFITRQWVVSCVVLAVLQCSGAMRFMRPVRYAAPPVRNYYYPWKHVPFAMLPKSMQRRFMWKEVDETMDDLVDGVTTGARAMTHMFSPPAVRYHKPMDFEAQPSSKVKYVLKKPSPFKRMKVVKFRAPKKPVHVYQNPVVEHVSSSHIYKSPPVEQVPSVVSSTKPNLIVPYMSSEELRKIEKEQERRVESGLVGSGLIGSGHVGSTHEHSHQVHMDDDVVSGRINEFGEGWLPIQTPFSTSKPFAMSTLHTKVLLPAPLPSESAAFESASLKDFRTSSYEVTEHSAEESIQKETSFKPSNQLDFLTTTTEIPNYPEHFLKSMQESQTFKPMRVRIPITTTPAVTTTYHTVKPTLSNRLPPRSTTERPFKRFNLHRPKSSKLFFSRPPNAPAGLEQIRSIVTTEQSIPVSSEPEPFKTTTQTSIRTTRESPRTTTTTTSTAKPLPEKIRTTRNNSEVKSKLRIKNVSQNEGLKRVLNKHRGSVKFGEKQS